MSTSHSGPMPSRTSSGRTAASVPNGTVRLAAVGDLHCSKHSLGRLHDLLAGVVEQADVLLLCGDLTDYGLPEEAKILGRELGSIAARIPIVGVLGNHDYESGK